MPPDSVVVVLRAAVFVTLLQAAGAALFLFLFKGRVVVSGDSIRRLGAIAAALGTALVIVRYLIEPARMTGALSGVLDGSMHRFLLTSNLGLAQLIRLAGAGLVGLGLLRLRSSRLRERGALVGVLLIAGSFSFMGHTAAGDQRWLLGGLLVVHVLAAAFWFGSLIPLYIACGRESLRDAGALIERYSAIAVRIVPMIFVAGVGMAVYLLPGLGSLGTPYGLLLIVKVLVFAVLMGIACLNKYRFGPAVACGRADSLVMLRRCVAIETVLIACILTVTAVMTTLYSPES